MAYLLLKTGKGFQYQIITTADGIWINHDSGLIGRFSRRGLDIHTLYNTCLDCKSKFTTPEDWLFFKNRIMELYSIDLAAKVPDFDSFINLELLQNN